MQRAGQSGAVPRHHPFKTITNFHSRALADEGSIEEHTIQMSPSMYLQFLTALAKNYSQSFHEIEEKRNRLEKVLQKFETISSQVDELKQELSDLQPRFEQINSDIETKKENLGQLQSQRTAGMSAYKQLDAKINDINSSLAKVETDYNEKMKEDQEKVSGKLTFKSKKNILSKKID